MQRLLAITHTRRLFRSLVVHERDYLLTKAPAERQSIAKKMKTTERELGDVGTKVLFENQGGGSEFNVKTPEKDEKKNDKPKQENKPKQPQPNR